MPDAPCCGRKYDPAPDRSGTLRGRDVDEGLALWFRNPLEVWGGASVVEPWTFRDWFPEDKGALGELFTGLASGVVVAETRLRGVATKSCWPSPIDVQRRELSGRCDPDASSTRVTLPRTREGIAGARRDPALDWMQRSHISIFEPLRQGQAQFIICQTSGPLSHVSCRNSMAYSVQQVCELDGLNA